MHEHEYKSGLAHDCVEKFCISVATGKTIVKEKVHFVKSSEDLIFWKEFLEPHKKVGKDASNNCC